MLYFTPCATHDTHGIEQPTGCRWYLSSRVRPLCYT